MAEWRKAEWLKAERLSVQLSVTREGAKRRPRVVVFHGGDVEVHRFEIGNREKRKGRELRQVHRLQVSAAGAARLDAPVLPLGVRSGGDERFGGIVAVDA